VAALREAGVLPEDANLGAARTKVVMDAQSQAKPKAPAEEQTEPPLDPVHAEGMLLAQQYGLAEGDAELAMIKQGQGVKAYLDSIEEAGKAKQARLKGSKPSEEKDEGEPFPVDTAGSTDTGNPIEDITDPTELLEMGLGLKD
jgi:hypothetical protein